MNCNEDSVTWHHETVLQRWEEMRISLSMHEILLDQVKHLTGTFSFYMDLVEKKIVRVNTLCSLFYLASTKSSTCSYCVCLFVSLIWLTLSKRFDIRSSSSFLNISKKSRCLKIAIHGSEHRDLKDLWLPQLKKTLFVHLESYALSRLLYFTILQFAVELILPNGGRHTKIMQVEKQNWR